MTNATLTPVERKLMRRAMENARDADCVVLVGSLARGTRASPLGDIDLVVVNGRARKLLHSGFQTTVLTYESLRDRVYAGDDFAQWALRFGVPLRGRREWQRLQRELLQNAPWPSPAVKLGQASRRLRTAGELLELGDHEAAQEDLLYAASHLARATLLGLGIFPLSRPELAPQLIEAGRLDLAALIDQLRLENDLSTGQVRRLFDDVRAAITTRGDAAGSHQLTG